MDSLHGRHPFRFGRFFLKGSLFKRTLQKPSYIRQSPIIVLVEWVMWTLHDDSDPIDFR